MKPTGSFALPAVLALLPPRRPPNPLRKDRNQRFAARTGAVVAVAALGVAAFTGAAAHAAATATAADHWGSFFGSSGGKDADPVHVPTAMPLPAPVVQLGTSNSDEYALLANGTLWAWGQGGYGELGDGQTTDSLHTAVQVQFPAGVTIASIPTDAMPFDTGLAVDANGNLWGWGYNKGGELCTGNSSMYTTPVELTAWGAPVTAVAGANEHVTADAGGVLESCGWNSDGVLGDGQSKAATTKPVPVSGISGADVTAVTQSFDNAGALLSNGTYWDWGYNAAGQVGNGTTVAQDTPYQVQLPDPSPVVAAAQGGSAAVNGQVLVMLADGAMYAWGSDSCGQLGDDSTTAKLSPVAFTAPPGVSYAQLISAGSTSYGITASGDVYAWGCGNAWQIGDGSTAAQMTPVMVDSGAVMGSATANNMEVAG